MDLINPLVESIVTQGVLGVCLVIVCIAYYHKDKLCANLQEKRLCDLREVKDQYTALIREINTTLDKLVAQLSSIHS